MVLEESTISKAIDVINLNVYDEGYTKNKFEKVIHLLFLGDSHSRPDNLASALLPILNAPICPATFRAGDRPAQL